MVTEKRSKIQEVMLESSVEVSPHLGSAITLNISFGPQAAHIQNISISNIFLIHLCSSAPLIFRSWPLLKFFMSPPFSMIRIMGRVAHFIYLFMLRLVVYFAVLALLFVITVIALKYLGEWRDHSILEDEEGESSPLMSQCNTKISTTTTTYGACQNDIESANCSSSSGSGSGGSNDRVSNYCTELYDAKVCIICYDQQRNCFFVPCGHCATCFPCAQRLLYEENKKCPVCRRFIGKIRGLLFNS